MVKKNNYIQTLVFYSFSVVIGALVNAEIIQQGDTKRAKYCKKNYKH